MSKVLQEDQPITAVLPGNVRIATLFNTVDDTGKYLRLPTASNTTWMFKWLNLKHLFCMHFTVQEFLRIARGSEKNWTLVKERNGIKAYRYVLHCTYEWTIVIILISTLCHANVLNYIDTRSSLILITAFVAWEDQASFMHPRHLLLPYCTTQKWYLFTRFPIHLEWPSNMHSFPDRNINQCITNCWVQWTYWNLWITIREWYTFDTPQESAYWKGESLIYQMH